MSRWTHSIDALLRDDGGAVIVEYAIVAAAIAVPALAMAASVTAQAGTTLTSTTSGLQVIGANPP